MIACSSHAASPWLALDQVGRRRVIYMNERPQAIRGLWLPGSIMRETERMLTWFAGSVRSLIVGLLLCSSATCYAADSGQLGKRGKAILAEHCGRCHAIGPVGASPLNSAPPMREVYARFAPRELQAELSEGMVSRHREMPQIDFSDEDVDAILAYLYALAIRK
jgi:mono/diheme cytochrome c family protein